ncbi:MAG TPA: hypothetical protein VMZ03_12265 [Chitinophagaceae bacterium]|nr:hypothetical protein [Chitinophagaceae bacterium]
MKKFIPFIAIMAFLSILLVACKNNTPQPQVQPQADTTGLAAFQAFKAMETQAVVAVPQQIVYKKRPVKKVVMNSESTNEAKVAEKENGSDPSTEVKTTDKEVANQETGTVAKEEEVAKKKGWSKAAKYGAIGGVGGGVLGAVINKKDPVKGAVIGAVILGGGGYVLGRSQDKKDGRVN